MESKLLNVFYDSSYLPYKDSERTVHFPIGGGTFAGSQNTFRIRFYPKDLVGGNDYVAQTSWVLVSKLPNGKLGYELLSTIGTDSVLGEKYIQFDMSAYYTQAKGVVKLALRGYQGQIEFTDLDDEGNELPDGTYRVVGTPIIGVTGTIDIAINYSPMVYGEQLLPDELSQLVAKFSDYLTLTQYDDDKENFVQRQTYDPTLTIQDLLDNYGLRTTFIIDSLENTYVMLIDEAGIGVYNFKAYRLTGTNIHIYGGVLPSTATTLNYIFSTNYQDFYVDTIARQDYVDDEIYSVKSWVGNNYYDKTETLSTTQINNAIDNAMDNVMTLIEHREFQKVDVEDYPTLNDFLATTGHEGYIYLYPIDTSDETKGFYQYIWENSAWLSLGTTVIDLSDYVQKTTSANKVYGTNDQGAQTTYTVDDFYDGNIARRDSDGSITVPLTPSANGEATSKKYVDDSFVFATDSEVDALF